MSTSATPDWLGPLLEAYRRVRSADAKLALDGMADRLFDEVLLAHTAAHRLALGPAQDPGLQVVVLGPTQAGKSTLVNTLLGEHVAGVNALAGHTVHAQAFTPAGSSEQVVTALETLMAPLLRAPHAELQRDRLDTWSCEPVASAAALIEATFWDTPDFDSIEAARYRDAVTLASGVADVILLVLSKDKYGDLSVWRQLSVLRALGTPLVLLVNKLDEPSRAVVAHALAARWREHAPDESNADGPIATVLLPWLGNGERSSYDRPTLDELRKALQAASKAAQDHDARKAALVAFIDARRDGWLAPLRREHAARTRWHTAVSDAANTIRLGYRTRYLDEPDRYDAFDRTLVELLTLLELPGIAHALARTRQAVTWPARKLLGLGLGTASDVASRFGMRRGMPRADAASHEREVLGSLLDTALTSLRELAFEEREDAPRAAYWQNIERTLVRGRTAIEQDWTAQAEALRNAFQPRIDAAARALYERLQTQPALLNTLRATRVTTDVAGVALAVKSGGIAPADLILAPAMLSVTTLLTESALGRYLDGVKRELKNQQETLVARELVQPVFTDRLLALATDVEGSMLLSGKLDPALQRVLDQSDGPG